MAEAPSKFLTKIYTNKDLKDAVICVTLTVHGWLVFHSTEVGCSSHFVQDEGHYMKPESFLPNYHRNKDPWVEL